MKRDEKHSWFFKNDWENIDNLLIKLNTGIVFREALKAVYSGKTYREAAKLYGTSAQNISQWLNRRTGEIERGRLKIEIHRENIQAD